MLTIPLYSFLFVYWLFVALFVFFMLVNLYHIISTASFTLPSFLFTFFIFAGTTLVLYGTFMVLGDAGIDWQTRVVLFHPDWLGNVFTQEPF